MWHSSAEDHILTPEFLVFDTQKNHCTRVKRKHLSLLYNFSLFLLPYVVLFWMLLFINESNIKQIAGAIFKKSPFCISTFILKTGTRGSPWGKVAGT
jgi:hypothetical protein